MRLQAPSSLDGRYSPTPPTLGDQQYEQMYQPPMHWLLSLRPTPESSPVYSRPIQTRPGALAPIMSHRSASEPQRRRQGRRPVADDDWCFDPQDLQQDLTAERGVTRTRQTVLSPYTPTPVQSRRGQDYGRDIQCSMPNSREYMSASAPQSRAQRQIRDEDQDEYHSHFQERQQTPTNVIEPRSGFSQSLRYPQDPLNSQYSSIPPLSSNSSTPVESHRRRYMRAEEPESPLTGRSRNGRLDTSSLAHTNPHSRPHLHPHPRAQSEPQRRQQRLQSPYTSRPLEPSPSRQNTKNDQPTITLPHPFLSNSNHRENYMMMRGNSHSHPCRSRTMRVYPSIEALRLRRPAHYPLEAAEFATEVSNSNSNLPPFLHAGYQYQDHNQDQDQGIESQDFGVPCLESSERGGARVESLANSIDQGGHERAEFEYRGLFVRGGVEEGEYIEDIAGSSDWEDEPTPLSSRIFSSPLLPSFQVSSHHSLASPPIRPLPIPIPVSTPPPPYQDFAAPHLSINDTAPPPRYTSIEDLYLCQGRARARERWEDFLDVPRQHHEWGSNPGVAGHRRELELQLPAYEEIDISVQVDLECEIGLGEDERDERRGGIGGDEREREVERGRSKRGPARGYLSRVWKRIKTFFA